MIKQLTFAFSCIVAICALAPLANADNLTLTEQEQNYLKEHPTLSMCIDPDWLPYEKINDNGDYVGLVAEYMTLFQSKLGIEFAVVKTNTWKESEQLYQEGKCDIVSALNKSDERSVYLDFSQPYITSPAVLLLHQSNLKDNLLEDLNGKSLAIVDGYIYQSELHENYPNIKIVMAPNMENAIQQVASKQVDATIGPLFLSMALLQKLNIDNVKMVGNTVYKDELRIGINKKHPVLPKILDKLIANLTPQDHANARNVWLKKARSNSN